MPYSLIYGERTLRSVANSTRQDVVELLQLAAEIPIHTDVEVYPLEAANDALARVKRSEVRGTWLDSHFGWQLRTFWYAALWILVVVVLSTPLILLLGLGLITMWLGISLVGLWILSRVVRGWLALKDRRPV